MRIIENLAGISLWQTLEMKIPMEVADTAVRLDYKVCGSTCTFKTIECDFFWRLYGIPS
jgi:hypothetical protein